MLFKFVSRTVDLAHNLLLLNISACHNCDLLPDLIGWAFNNNIPSVALAIKSVLL